MYSHYQVLPPVKRLRLMQQKQQEEEEEQQQSGVASLKLPAKKRKESRSVHAGDDNGVLKMPPLPTTTFCLPTKKRVWAFLPDTFPYDLNVKYQDKETSNVQSELKLSPMKKNVVEEIPFENREKLVGKIEKRKRLVKMSAVEDRNNPCQDAENREKKMVKGDEDNEKLIENRKKLIKKCIIRGSPLVEIENREKPIKKDEGRTKLIGSNENRKKSVEVKKNREVLVQKNECRNKSFVKNVTKGSTFEENKIREDLMERKKCSEKSVRNIVVKAKTYDENENRENSDEEAEGRETVIEKNENLEMENEEEDEDGIVCAICESTDGDPTDPIVLCDGCDLMVHASCYGNPLIKGIPEGNWFCHQCIAKKSKSSKQAPCCCLCPMMGGALKPTSDARWAHVVCAVYVPEVFFVDGEGREGIDCSQVCRKRWEGKCYVCKERRNGCVVDCSEPKCGLAFHVTCGLKEDLCIEYKQGKNKEGGVVAAFCKDHTELWKKQQQTGKFRIVAREDQMKA